MEKQPFEGGDDYPDVIAHWRDGEDLWRLIRSVDSAPATQWILQYRKTAEWRPEKFMQSKVGIDLFVAPPPDSEAYEIVRALPEWCPQRDAILRRSA